MTLKQIEDLEPVVVVESLSKSYTYDSVLSDASKLGGEQKGDWITALENISFSLKKGEVLGLIGNNGSGKSTLLKLISGISKPTSGTITTRGIIASILEVGTGFHPELSGKDNVFLSGAILGMDTASLKEVYTDIIEFSGLQDFIDVPVKKYSSGMYMRLAFSVVAHVNADIVLLDEVFSVGDAGFIRKSEKKLRELIDSNRTIIMASHDLNSISKIATSLLVLKNGRQEYFGGLEQGLTEYVEAAIFQTSEAEQDRDNSLLKNETLSESKQLDPEPEPRIIHDENPSRQDNSINAGHSDTRKLSDVRYESPKVVSRKLAADTFTLNSTSILNTQPYEVFNDQSIELCFDFTVHRDNNYQFAIVLSYNLQTAVLTSTPDSDSQASKLLKNAGSCQVVFSLPPCLLNSGVYSVGVYIIDVHGKEADKAEGVFYFKVVFSDRFRKKINLAGHFPGPLVSAFSWSVTSA